MAQPTTEDRKPVSRKHLPFINRNREIAVTTSASQSNKKLGAAGHKNGNVGQGVEQEDLMKKLNQFLDGEANHEDRSYNTTAGGPEEVKEAFSGFGNRFFGVPAHKESTFVQEQLGRSMFCDVADLWFKPFKSPEFWKEFTEHGKRPAVLVPKNTWGMTKTIFEDAGFEVIQYDVDPNDISGSYEKALEEHSQTHIIAGSYFNYPHNATGAHLTVEENKKMKEIADNHNRNNPQYKMNLMYDLPYYGACKRSAADMQAYLDTGMEGVFDPADFDPNSEGEVVTPVAIIASGSKFFRTAKRGLNFSYVTKDLAKPVNAKLIRTGHGLNYDPVFYDNLTRGLQPEYDGWWLDQLDADRTKYETNYSTLQKHFGDAVLPGDVNLVELVKQLPDLFNREVVRHDGEKHVIRAPEDGGVTDLLELYDNGIHDTEGVVMVDGGKGPDGSTLSRIALASNPKVFEENILRIKKITDYIRKPYEQQLEEYNLAP